VDLLCDFVLSVFEQSHTHTKVLVLFLKKTICICICHSFVRWQRPIIKREPFNHNCNDALLCEMKKILIRLCVALFIFSQLKRATRESSPYYRALRHSRPFLLPLHLCVLNCTHKTHVARGVGQKYQREKASHTHITVASLCFCASASCSPHSDRKIFFK
jgi:hypothetical protein